jgi:hypothetical protein
MYMYIYIYIYTHIYIHAHAQGQRCDSPLGCVHTCTHRHTRAFKSTYCIAATPHLVACTHAHIDTLEHSRHIRAFKSTYCIAATSHLATHSANSAVANPAPKIHGTRYVVVCENTTIHTYIYMHESSFMSMRHTWHC